jgi:hypothetical protein
MVLWCFAGAVVGRARHGLFDEPRGIEARRQNAIRTLKKIAEAQSQFRERLATSSEVDLGHYGDLAALTSAGLVRSDLSRESSYVFHVQPSVTTSEFLWFAVAEPVSWGEPLLVTNHVGVIFQCDVSSADFETVGCDPCGSPWTWPDYSISFGKSCPISRVATLPVDLEVREP